MTAVISPQIQSVSTRTNFSFAKNYGEWASLPPWGTCFINIGHWVAQADSRENRLVIALAIPIRNYAAALAALGVVLARANISTSKIDSNSHFEKLCRLPKGTPVNYQINGKRYKGIYLGVNKDYGEPRLRIQRENKSSGGLTDFIRQEECHNVAIASTQHINLPKKQTGRPIFVQNEFLNAVISEAELLQFTTETRLECAVIGRVNTLRQEIKEVPFACSSSKSEFKTGCLNDVLRVRNFCISEGQAYRSEVLPALGNNPPQTTNGLIPHVTIFDGATGFLKWRDNWRNSHWIVLLERTEPHFQEAVIEINNEYGNRFDGEEIQNIPCIPPGVELVVYQEARQ
ncbi:hypothetical protein [Scytonema sp. NUACC26]|uniref:hypothetical protein n=1 Tax=Scytonema sp. NUACC26 TaxID=3140176 RepID=UPI0034DBC9F3